MPAITIDGKKFEVNEGQNVLHAVLSLGLDLPYFCWHPALDSVGACRQCAVKQFKDDKDTRGRIVMACMTPAIDGARISIDDPEAKEFRASVAEWLMTNHPHDCPVCDEGGECHLQDMTLMTGHNYRRFRFKKRTFRNQYLGPFINHEMNRCIACYRCVRFYNDFAGGKDFNVFAIHNDVFFGRYDDGVLENEFSGNLVEVCPTGVFTDKTLKKHFTRKWDLQNAPSICHQCGLGCNTIAGERYGSLRRIRNRYNYEVNGYFLCDRGRYGYEFVNSDRRIREPHIRTSSTDGLGSIDKTTALDRFSSYLKSSNGIIGIGSSRASLESNFVLQSLVGPGLFSNGMTSKTSGLISKILSILQNGPMRSASLLDVEHADAVLILGEDVTNTAPRIALSVRQAVRQQSKNDAAGAGIPVWHDAAVREHQQKKSGPLYIAAPVSTKLDDIATQAFSMGPDDIARLGFAIAHELNIGSPKVDGVSETMLQHAKQIAAVLKGAERPLIISGTSLANESIIEAAANIARALCDARRTANVCYAVPDCNTLGVSCFQGISLDVAFALASKGTADTVIIVENDLYRHARKDRVDLFLKSMKHVIVIDHLKNATTAVAELLLPAATFAEGSGTLVSSEGRAQRFFEVFVPKGDIQESWRWLRDAMIASGRKEALGWRILDDVIDALAVELPTLGGVREAAPRADFRIENKKIPRALHQYSGRTAMNANISVHEPKPSQDPDTALSYSMEGYPGHVPASVTPYFWTPAWNSGQATNKYQTEVAGPTIGGDSGVRLLEPRQNGGGNFFDNIPASSTRREGEWLVVPLYHIFGSEELSVVSPGVAECAPGPYVALNPGDAGTLGLKEGMEVELTVAGGLLHLPAVYRSGLPHGAIGIPVGLPGLSGTEITEWSRAIVRVTP